MIWLEFFSSEARREHEEAQIRRIHDCAWMIRMMDALKSKVYRFADYGPEFVDILNVCYMNMFDYTEDDALEQLGMGRSTFFKKKKRAIILFGLAFQEYKMERKMENQQLLDEQYGVQIEMRI